MDESKETKKTRNITFRLTGEQYEQVESAALAAGEDPNSWCRKVALIQLSEGFGLTKNDRLLYEEIARVRYLVGHGFRLLLGSKKSPLLPGRSSRRTWTTARRSSPTTCFPGGDNLN
jgi:hypothetical protein